VTSWLCASLHTGTQGKVPATSQGRASPRYSSETRPPGARLREVRAFEAIDSTNRYLIDEAIAGAEEGLVAVAGYQSAGRGRLGRTWEAPPGDNLLVSFLLKPRFALEELHLCTAVVALAAADACVEVAGVEPELVWPNDLYVARRKLAGVLAESVPARKNTGAQRAVVVGLGLNVRWPPPGSGDDTPGEAGELVRAATSLWREAAESLSTRSDSRVVCDVPEVRDVLGQVLEGLEHRVGDLDDAEGRGRVGEEYRRRCATVGRKVRVVIAGETLEGTAVDLSLEGHLILDAGGRSCTVTTGDVIHVDW